MGYVCLSSEIRTIIQEQFPLQLGVNYSFSSTRTSWSLRGKKDYNYFSSLQHPSRSPWAESKDIKNCFFVYHQKNKAQKLLKSVNPVSLAKSYMASNLASDDVKVYPLFFVDECGKKYFLDKMPEHASVVGPFEMKGETYVAVNAVLGPVVGPFKIKSETTIFYNKTADGFTRSKKYQISADQQRCPKLLYAHPQGHYLITINRGEMYQWYKITPQDNGTFAQEKILKTDRLYQHRGDEKVWPMTEDKIACLCKYHRSSDYWIKRFDVTTKEIIDEMNITEIFNKIRKKYADEISEKLWMTYEKNIDCDKLGGISSALIWCIQNVEYSPQQEKLLFNSTIAGPPVPGKDIRYLAMVNFLYSIPSSESEIVPNCEIVKADKKYSQKAAKIFCHFGPQLTTQAQVISKETQFFLPEIRFCKTVDDDILINAACWWLQNTHKKLQHGLSLIRAVNSAQSTVWLNYISSYKKGKSCLSIVYDTLHNCGLLENIKKGERVYLFRHVYRVMRIRLIQDMIKKVKKRKVGPLTEEKSVAIKQFEKSTYEDPLVFPWHTYVDGNKTRSKLRIPNITFVNQVEAAWKAQDKNVLRKMVREFSKL
jgi:hypothetical protein